MRSISFSVPTLTFSMSTSDPWIIITIPTSLLLITVRDNSAFYKTDFDTELNRVIVHGILHLIGYDDHCDEDIAEMRAKENYYLDLRKNLQ